MSAETARGHAFEAISAAWPVEMTALMSFLAPPCRKSDWEEVLRHILPRVVTYDPKLSALETLLQVPAIVAVYREHGLSALCQHAAECKSLRMLRLAWTATQRAAETQDNYVRFVRDAVRECCDPYRVEPFHEGIVEMLGLVETLGLGGAVWEGLSFVDLANTAMSLFGNDEYMRTAKLLLDSIPMDEWMDAFVGEAVVHDALGMLAMLLGRVRSSLPAGTLALTVAYGSADALRLLSQSAVKFDEDDELVTEGTIERIATTAFWLRQGAIVGLVDVADVVARMKAQMTDMWETLASSQFLWRGVFAVCTAWNRGDVVRVRTWLKTWEPPIETKRRARLRRDELLVDYDFQRPPHCHCAADAEWWRPWKQQVVWRGLVEPCPAIALIGWHLHGGDAPAAAIRRQPLDVPVIRADGTTILTKRTAQERILFAREVSWARRFWALALWKAVHDARTRC